MDNAKIAVYGRRRVGKTFLVRETFDYTFTFQHSGLANSGMKRQLKAFAGALRESGLEISAVPYDWLDAFDALKDVIRRSDASKKVVFIDEMPWMDTPKSGFVSALENFWNGWAVISQLASAPFVFAVIFAFPAFFPVISPYILTDATAELLLLKEISEPEVENAIIVFDSPIFKLSL